MSSAATSKRSKSKGGDGGMPPSKKQRGSSIKPALKYRLSRPIHSPKTYDPTDSYDWRDFVDRPDFSTPPVHAFPTAPLHDIWKAVLPNLKFEVPNWDFYTPQKPCDVFWFATVIKVAGYKALLRYEGLDDNANFDFWMNICCEDLHPIGYCSRDNKMLVAPHAVQTAHPDIKEDASEWRAFLASRVAGARTFPYEFTNLVKNSLECKFKPGMKVELTDRKKLSRIRPAVIKEVIGNRLRVAYEDDTSVVGSSDLAEEDEENEFWCNSKSSLLHPVGWAVAKGHAISCTEEYKRTCKKKLSSDKYDANDASPDLFDEPKAETNSLLKFEEGMKLEALDPLDLSSIVPATVKSILRDGYMMVSFDLTTDSFCFHESSPYIFPAGFCEMNGISLTLPKELKDKFTWKDYLEQTKAVTAPTACFNTPIAKHIFSVGQKLECTDLMDSKLVCVATIAEVKGRLLRIHFDGWEDGFDQYIDCFSPDIYPVGYCEMVGHKLEPPKEDDDNEEQTSVKKTQSAKSSSKKKKGTSKSANKMDSLLSRAESVVTRDSESSLGRNGAEGRENMEVHPSLSFPSGLQDIPCTQWTPEHLVEFLNENGMDEFSDNLYAQDVDGSLFLTLDHKQLNEPKFKLKASQVSQLCGVILALQEH